MHCGVSLRGREEAVGRGFYEGVRSGVGGFAVRRLERFRGDMQRRAWVVLVTLVSSEYSRCSINTF